MSFTVIIALALTAFVALFSIQNAQQVQVNFFKWYFEASLVIVLMLAFAIGLVTAALLSVPSRIRKSRDLAECRRRVRDLEKEQIAVLKSREESGAVQGGEQRGSTEK
jgi:lipopolysaccharide assembly protein A